MVGRNQIFKRFEVSPLVGQVPRFFHNKEGVMSIKGNRLYLEYIANSCCLLNAAVTLDTWEYSDVSLFSVFKYQFYLNWTIIIFLLNDMYTIIYFLVASISNNSLDVCVIYKSNLINFWKQIYAWFIESHFMQDRILKLILIVMSLYKPFDKC